MRHIKAVPVSAGDRAAEPTVWRRAPLTTASKPGAATSAPARRVPEYRTIGGLPVLCCGDDTARSTVVFVHGWGATKELWWNAISRLPDGVRGIAIDIRRDPDTQSMGDLAHWLSDWLPNLNENQQVSESADSTHPGDIGRPCPKPRLYLAGHSMGGNLCAETALSYPDLLDGLILVDAALLVDGLPARARWSVSTTYGMAALRAARLAAWPFGLIGSRVRHDHDGGHWAPYARRAWLYVQGGDDCALQRHMQVLLQNRITPDRLCTLSIPILIIHGERDGIVPVEHARRFAAAMPDAMLRIMPKSMHCPMDWDPAAFAGYLSEFLTASNTDATGSGVATGLLDPVTISIIAPFNGASKETP